MAERLYLHYGKPKLSPSSKIICTHQHHSASLQYPNNENRVIIPFYQKCRGKPDRLPDVDFVHTELLWKTLRIKI